MKNTARLILATIAVVAAIVSCTKELNPGKADTDPAARTLRTITVSFDTPAKSYLDSLKPRFSEGDSILVHSLIQSVYDTCIVSVKNGIATITTELTGLISLYYPLSSTKIESESLHQFVPPIQTGRFDDANICSARINSEGTMAVFENLYPILRFYADESIGVDTIRIKSSKPLAGLHESPDSVITVAPPKADATAGNVEEAASAAEQASVQDPRIWYVAVAGGLNANDLTFESVTTTQGTVEKTPTTDLQLESGKIYNAFIPYYIGICNGFGTPHSPDTLRLAYCNVGAFLPEEPGLYFMWGEVQGHKAEGGAFDFSGFAPFEADRDRYLKADASQGFHQCNAPYYDATVPGYTKYSDTDTLTTLELFDDAANANWGGNWRMPTQEEFSIFPYGVQLPLFIPTGMGENTILKSDTYYWTKSTANENKEKAMAFKQVNSSFLELERWKGCPIRPIYDESITEDGAPTVTISAYLSGGTL